MRGGEQVVDTVDDGEVAGLRRLVLRVPALQLATHELVAPGEVAQPDGVDVDGVEGDERVDQRPARVGVRFRVERPLGGGGVVQDDAGDVGHHVERRADHVRVRAGGHRLRDRNGCRPERVDDAVLAAHVVRGREDAVQRWAAHHELASVGVGHVRGDVRLAAGDELGAERCREPRQCDRRPARERLQVDPGRRAPGTTTGP